MPNMITINKAADLTGLKYYTIRKWCIDGTFKGFVKIGNKYYINMEMFAEFLNKGTCFTA